MRLQTAVRIGFVVLILLANGCRATPHVGVKNFDHRDRPQIRDEYLWVSLEWKW